MGGRWGEGVVSLAKRGLKQTVFCCSFLFFFGGWNMFLKILLFLVGEVCLVWKAKWCWSSTSRPFWGLLEFVVWEKPR